MAMAYQDIQAARPSEFSLEADPEAFPARRPADVAALGTGQSREWERRVLTLLDEAARQLQSSQIAHGTILEAASLLRKQIGAQPTHELHAEGGRLLAWQARRVSDYVDSHITGPIPVAELCALIGRSEAHFSRSFKRTFGKSPHAFVIRRRLELAAQYMLQSDASLSDIAARCGFTDQAHLCKQFRRSMGQTPAAWRRACRTHELGCLRQSRAF
jgi:AraC family transcriptional regulator